MIRLFCSLILTIPLSTAAILANANEQDDSLWSQFKSRFVKVDKSFYDVSNIDANKEPKTELEKYIPDIKVGAHGIIDSYRVVNILGDNDFLITDIHYGFAGRDRDSVMRVHGISTKNMVTGKTFSGTSFYINIAIVGTWKYRTVAGADHTAFLAAPVAAIKQGLSKDQFAELLQDKDIRAKFEKEAAAIELKKKEEAAAAAKAKAEASRKAELQYQGAAVAKLSLAKTYLANGNKELAIRKLKEIINDYPRAECVKEAISMLDKIK